MPPNTNSQYLDLGEKALRAYEQTTTPALAQPVNTQANAQPTTSVSPLLTESPALPSNVVSSFNFQDQIAPVVSAASPQRNKFIEFIRRPAGLTNQVILVLALIVVVGVPSAGVGLARFLHHASSTTQASKPKTSQQVVSKPAAPTPTQPAPAPAPTSKPTPKPAPAPAPPPPPAPLPTLPLVAGKDTSYNLGVLVIKYFPLTANGQNINIAVTGDVGDPYSTIRQHTIDATNNLLVDLSKGTQYLGYNHNDPPSLTYHIVATAEHTTAVPINSTIHPGYPTYPDYYGIMNSHNICNYVNNQGVREVWLWAYQGPNKANGQPYLGIEESKMSGPHGDISNSYEWNDMPVCQHTYVVYTFNYGRGTAEAMHSWGHQIEAEMNTVNAPLFGLFQGPNYPPVLGVTGRCGSVHNPPNARFEYDWTNPTPHASDCENWNPDGIGATTQIGCDVWGCNDISDSDNAQLNWQIWMWQNLPGRNNTKTYQGKQLRNWWDVHGNFDSVMSSSKRLTL